MNKESLRCRSWRWHAILPLSSTRVVIELSRCRFAAVSTPNERQILMITVEYWLPGQSFSRNGWAVERRSFHFSALPSIYLRMSRQSFGLLTLRAHYNRHCYLCLCGPIVALSVSNCLFALLTLDESLRVIPCPVWCGRQCPKNEIASILFLF